MTSLATALRNLWSAQVVRFAIVGVCGTCIYYVAALTSLHAGLSIEAAHLLAFAISIVFSYVGQKLFTFRMRGGHRRSIWRFTIATAVIAGSQFLIVLGLRNLPIDAAVLFAISSVYYPIASFCFHSFWTFKQRSEPNIPTDYAVKIDPK